MSSLLQARSRTMGFILGGRRVLVLAPAVDMANHAPPGAANSRVHLDAGADRLVLQPTQPMEAGQVGQWALKVHASCKAI